MNCITNITHSITVTSGDNNNINVIYIERILVVLVTNWQPEYSFFNYIFEIYGNRSYNIIYHTLNNGSPMKQVSFPPACTLFYRILIKQIQFKKNIEKILRKFI